MSTWWSNYDCAFLEPPLTLSQSRVHPSLASCHPFLSCISHGNTSCGTASVLETSAIFVQKHQIRKILEVRGRQVLNYWYLFLPIWFDNFYGLQHGKHLQKSTFNSSLYTHKIDSLIFTYMPLRVSWHLTGLEFWTNCFCFVEGSKNIFISLNSC